MKVGSLFSGIGGFDLGLERAGMQVIWQSEIEPYCCDVLKKHWPNVPNLGDICGIKNPPAVDLICGGFPCTQTSTAAEIQSCRQGLDGKDSGLWFEYLRIVQEVRPIWVIVENPPGVLSWADTITAGLEGTGYRVSRFERTAWGVGAPHLRRRVFFIANPVRERCDEVARIGNSPAHVDLYPWSTPPRGTWRLPRSRAHRMDHGFPCRVDRIRALGNAIVPAIAEEIGRMILEIDSKNLKEKGGAIE